MSNEKQAAPLTDEQLDAQQSLALVQAQQAHVRVRTQIDVGLLYGTWGTVWLVGFGAMWAARSDAAPFDLPVAAAGMVLAVLLVGAAVLTATHTARQVRGVRGEDDLRGALYGWSWFIGFGTLFAVLSALRGQGVDPEVLGILWPTMSCLLVAVLYMMGAAVWRDPHMFALGAWFAVCVGAGVFVGMPGMLAVMSLAGGGGFLVAAAYFTIRRLRERG